MKRAEAHFRGHDGIKLFYQEWLQDNPKGLLVISHGQGEHSDSYNRLISGIKDTGYNFVSWDWRGHGRSDGKRGFALSFTDYIKDYEIFINHILSAKDFEKLPIVLLGHSMGGLIQLGYLRNLDFDSSRIKAQVLSSPLLGLTVQVPKTKDFAARMAYRVYPELTLHNELNDAQFSRDPEILATFPKDPLRHHKISPGVYLGFLEEIEKVFQNAKQLQLPTLMQLSGSDTVVSTPAAERFFEILGSKIKKKFVYPDRHHESYNDLGREEVYADLREFLTPIKA